jgi:hypothetical protein
VHEDDQLAVTPWESTSAVEQARLLADDVHTHARVVLV